MKRNKAFYNITVAIEIDPEELTMNKALKVSAIHEDLLDQITESIGNMNQGEEYSIDVVSIKKRRV